MTTKVYFGWRRSPTDLRVWVSVRTAGSEILQDLKHHPAHSPEGFEWGHGYAGAADLALAILIDHLGENPTKSDLYNGQSLAWHLHQPFKRQLVAKFGPQWNLTADDISKWLEQPGVRRAVAEWQVLRVETALGWPV
jgi:hypothetical protein